MTNSFNMSNWRRKYVLVSETDKVLDENVYQDNKMLILKSIIKDDRIHSEEEAMAVFDMMEKFNMSQDQAIDQYLESKYEYEKEKGGDREDDTMPDSLMEEENPIDIISMDVPLFIRMLEFAREDASTDMDLHDLAQKAIKMSSEGEPLTMMHYDELVSKGAPVADAMSLYEKYFNA